LSSNPSITKKKKKKREREREKRPSLRSWMLWCNSVCNPSTPLVGGVRPYLKNKNKNRNRKPFLGNVTSFAGIVNVPSGGGWWPGCGTIWKWWKLQEVGPSQRK
jgi:hypothetical protein